MENTEKYISAKTKGNFSAFPADYRLDANAAGLTKREYMATAAMQAIITNGKIIDPSAIIYNAVMYADRLIAELNK